MRLKSALVTTLLFAACAAGSLAGQIPLPPSARAPKPGEKASDFTLPDSNGRVFRLSEALAGRDAAGKQVKGLLLVVYRGYW